MDSEEEMMTDSGGLDSEDGFGGPSASGFDFDDYDMDMEIE